MNHLAWVNSRFSTTTTRDLVFKAQFRKKKTAVHFCLLAWARSKTVSLGLGDRDRCQESISLWAVLRVTQAACILCKCSQLDTAFRGNLCRAGSCSACLKIICSTRCCYTLQSSSTIHSTCAWCHSDQAHGHQHGENCVTWHCLDAWKVLGSQWTGWPVALLQL